MATFLLSLAAFLVTFAPCVFGQGRELIMYDFTSLQSPSNVLHSFRNVRLAYKFKVTGTDRYIIVAENDQKGSLKTLRLPADALNVRFVPLRKTEDFFNKFLPFPRSSGYAAMPARDVTLMEGTWNVDYSEKELRSMVKSLASDRLSASNRAMETFVATGSVPFKELYFMGASDWDTAEELLQVADSYGGHRRLTTVVQKLHSI